MGKFRKFRARFWVKMINIIKVEQKILENGLHSRIMSKRPRLTENSKRRRVEIAEENVDFACSDVQNIKYS